jgi:hypothetical protein
LKKASLKILVLLLLISCKKKVQVDFSEDIIETSEGADIALNFPKAEGTNEVTNRINQTLKNYIIKQINVSENDDTNGNLKDAVATFNNDYKSFLILIHKLENSILKKISLAMRKDFPKS